MKKWAIVVMAALLLATVAAPALAGAPGEGKAAPKPQGGVPPTAGGSTTEEGPGGGWTEYPTRPGTASGGGAYAPSYQGGTQGDIWPPFLGDIFGWVGDNLNPGKWATDTINGALSGFLRITLGGLAQMVYWLYGRDVANPYAPAPGAIPSGSAPAAEGFNLILQTPPEYTYNSAEVGAILPNVRSAAMLLLGAALCWLAIRELIRLSTGESHGYHVGESVRRVVVATVLAAGGGYWLVSQMIQLNNLMTAAAVGDPLMDVLRELVMFDRTADALLTAGLIVETALLLLVLVVFLLIYALLMLGRIIVLDVLLIFSPLAGMAYAAEETEYIFNTWMRVAVGAVFYQFIGALFLKLAGVLMVNAWSGLTNGHPLLLALLSIGAVLMAISGPPILGFALSKAAGGMQRTVTRVAVQAASAAVV